jgi:isopenicillin N synthase-like dioxygenase
MGIPVVSLAKSDLEIAAAIRAAATAHGFFYIVDHGIPQSLIDAQYEWAKRLFALPEASKRKISLFNSKAKRGWEAIGDQTLDAEAEPDRKESFYCGVPYGPEHPYVKAELNGYGANQWPEELPEMAESCAAYIEATTKLCEGLMRHLARSLDLPPTQFDHTMAEPMITLRLLRYPPHPADAGANVFGAGAHTDWGAITVLAQDDSGGLQVLDADGKTWLDATPIPGSFVVNLGDMIPRWTNGLYRSNLHRVINKASAHDRYSVPLFYSPNYHAKIEALPGTVIPGEKPMHEPCTAGEHLAEMYRKSYGLKAA